MKNYCEKIKNLYLYRNFVKHIEFSVVVNCYKMIYSPSTIIMTNYHATIKNNLKLFQNNSLQQYKDNV
jgi:hypothetical protein